MWHPLKSLQLAGIWDSTVIVEALVALLLYVGIPLSRTGLRSASVKEHGIAAVAAIARDCRGQLLLLAAVRVKMRYIFEIGSSL